MLGVQLASKLISLILKAPRNCVHCGGHKGVDRSQHGLVQREGDDYRWVNCDARGEVEGQKERGRMQECGEAADDGKQVDLR